jgi:tetratricopeptide (TPR) repeat protein
MIALLVHGYLHAHGGNVDAAIEYVEQAARLNPLADGTYRDNIATIAHFLAGHYEAAVEFAERGIRDAPNGAANIRYLTASLALLGRFDEACDAVKRLLAITPDLTISRVRKFLEMDSPQGSKMREKLDAYCEGLRRGGLPE